MGQPIPLGKAAYDRAQLPVVTLKNCYYEQAPVNLEDQVSLRPRPRLKSFSTPGAGPIMGLYRKGGVLINPGFSGRIIALSGTALYNVSQIDGSATLIGSVVGDGLRMSAEGNDDVVVLTTGGALYSTDGSTLTGLTVPDSLAAYAVDTLNSYFLIASDLGRFYWTAIGGTTIDALDYATAESQPDILLTLKVIGDELWLFGRLSVEVWQPTGDLNLPFQRITGRIFGIGITARDTCQKLNVNGLDTVCWVGTDRRVYRTNPNPVRISDGAIEEKLGRSTVSFTDNSVNPYACTYSWQGHDFYVLHIPGEGSWAYDLHTGLWDEVTSYNHPHFRAACSAVGPNAQPLLGDDTTGTIWEMSEAQNTDGADPVVFEFTGILQVPGAPLRCDNVMLAISAGTAADPSDDPMIQMAWSDDGGATFGDNLDEPLGRQGERQTRILWPRLGMLRYPGRIFRWRTTEPATVQSAKYNESYRR